MRDQGVKARGGRMEIVARILYALLALAAIALTAHAAAVLPLNFDESFNLEIVKSLATHFAYETTYVPALVYDPRISSNGPLLYVAGLVFALSRNIDTTVVVTCAIGMAVLMLAAYLARPWVAGLLAVIFPFWVPFDHTAASVFGDVWAAAFIVFGVLVEERAARAGEARRGFLIAAGVLFGAAVASKLLALFIVLPLLAGLALQRSRRNDAAIILAWTVGFYLAQFTFSVLHTAGWTSFGLAAHQLAAFFHDEFTQGGVSMARGTPLTMIVDFSNKVVLLILIAAAALLVRKRPAFGLLVAMALAEIVIGHLQERRMMPMYLTILVLGARELDPKPRDAMLLMLGVLCLNPLLGYHLRKKFLHDHDRLYALGPYADAYHFHPKLISVLRSIPYVFNNGPEQFTTILVRYDLTFYDRLAPENARIPLDRSALFFDSSLKTTPPYISVAANCASIIYRDGPLVVCRPRTDRPISFEPGLPPGAPGFQESR